jgi:WD40 repeat protein
MDCGLRPLIQILAAVSDCTVRAWCASSGRQLHSLSVHSRPAHLVEAHPFHPRLALSAGYDGLLAIWDARTGEVLRM